MYLFLYHYTCHSHLAVYIAFMSVRHFEPHSRRLFPRALWTVQLCGWFVSTKWLMFRHCAAGSVPSRDLYCVIVMQVQSHNVTRVVSLCDRFGSISWPVFHHCATGHMSMLKKLRQRLSQSQRSVVEVTPITPTPRSAYGARNSSAGEKRLTDIHLLCCTLLDLSWNMWDARLVPAGWRWKALTSGVHFQGFRRGWTDEYDEIMPVLRDTHSFFYYFFTENCSYHI